MSETAHNSVELSILIPMYNEAAAVPALLQRLLPVLEQCGLRWEIVCVDDGSRDDTLALLRAAAAQEPRLKVVAFTRNFGKEAALTAALDHASGQALIPLDADLQDPPELIPQLLQRWREGYDVVHARRASRVHDSLLKRKTAAWFYTLFNRLSEVPIPPDVGDFRLLDRKVVDVIRQLPEKERFMKGLFCWPGFRSSTVDYERPARRDGQSRFNFWQLWNLALSGLASFTTLPIRAGIYLGLLIALLSFLYAFFIIFKTLVLGVDVPGYASIMVTMLFLGGVQLFFLGLIGEYIGRMYKEVKNRPLYVVAERIGCGGLSAGAAS